MRTHGGVRINGRRGSYRASDPGTSLEGIMGVLAIMSGLPSVFVLNSPHFSCCGRFRSGNRMGSGTRGFGPKIDQRPRLLHWLRAHAHRIIVMIVITSLMNPSSTASGPGGDGGMSKVVL